MFVEMK